MKKLLIVTLVLILLVTQFHIALANELFSVRGISFGMSLEEVQSVLGQGKVESSFLETNITYKNVGFSMFASGADFMCKLVANRVVCMGYSHPISNASDYYEYLEKALTEKYGQKKNLQDAFWSSFIKMYGYNASDFDASDFNAAEAFGVEALSTWEKGDVFIAELVSGESLFVMYIQKKLLAGYNTYGL